MLGDELSLEVFAFDEIKEAIIFLLGLLLLLFLILVPLDSWVPFNVPSYLVHRSLIDYVMLHFSFFYSILLFAGIIGLGLWLWRHR